MAVVTQRDSGRWQAKIRRQGWPDQSKTFRTQSDAQAWARAVEREMDIGAFINRNDAEKTTFKVAAEKYAKEILPSKRGEIQDKYVLKRLIEAFGAYSLASISPALLSKYRDDRLKVVSGQTVVHELNMVSRIFKACAMDWGIALPQGIPTALVRKPQIAAARERRLEPGEKELLLNALTPSNKNDGCASPWPHAAVVLAIETAGRQSELLALKWSEIDLVNKTARLRGKGGGVTKSGDAYRDIPLSDTAKDLLASLPRPAGGKVIPITQNALKLSWERACRRARNTHVHTLLKIKLTELGYSEEYAAAQIRALIYKKKIPDKLTIQLIKEIDLKDKTMVDLHFHDLRHEATSLLAGKLISMQDLMKITGHKSSRMLGNYYHPRAADLAKLLG